MVAQFEAGNQVPIGKQGRAQPGAEREHQFHAFALDGSVAGHIGVVAHPDRLAPVFFKFSLEREALGPEGMEVEAQVGAAVLDNAGEADRDAVEVADQLAQIAEARPGLPRAWARQA